MTQATATVTQAQIDACDRYVDVSTNTVFYLVESSSNPGTHYKVVYNAKYRVLQCLPHDGEACPASEKGIPCYHKRAARAAEAEYRAMKRAERAAQERIAMEQRTPDEIRVETEIEALVRGGLDRDTAIRVAQANAHPYQWPEREIQRDQARFQSRPFSLLK